MSNRDFDEVAKSAAASMAVKTGLGSSLGLGDPDSEDKAAKAPAAKKAQSNSANKPPLKAQKRKADDSRKADDAVDVLRHPVKRTRPEPEAVGAARNEAVPQAEPQAEAPTGDPREWSPSQVQAWFEAHAEGLWAKYAAKFELLDGERMSMLEKEDFLRRVPINGDAIYHDWQALKRLPVAAAAATPPRAVSYDYYAQREPVVGDKDQHFTINGSIDRLNRGCVFFVDPAETNEAVLLPAVRHGKNVMLHGPRASGKSTRMFRACDQLSEEFFVMHLTFQEAIELHSTTEAFWRSVGNALRNTWPHLPDVNSGLEFASLFAPANRATLFEGKQVVLFIDDFDLLEHATTDVHDQVLHVLRALKQNRAKRCLHSVVAVGTFSILRLNTRFGSLGQYHGDAVDVDLFSQEQVSSLFERLAAARNAGIDEQIAEDVFYRTDGHPGLVAWCGKIVDEKLLHTKGLADRAELLLDEWQAWMARNLVREIRGWQPMEKMVQLLLKPPEAAVEQARDLLLSSLLTCPSYVHVSSNEIPLAEFLVTEGAARKGDQARAFAVHNDLVRAVLLARVLPTVRTEPPVEPFPQKGGVVDVVAMLKRAVTCFSPAMSYKMLNLKGVQDGRRVPHEYSYQFQLFSVLQSWVPKEQFTMFCEVTRGHGNKRADIFIQGNSGGGESVVLELLASGTGDALDARCASTEEYKRALKATAAYVVHFIAEWPPAEAPPGHGGHSAVPIVSVYHDAAFSSVRVFA